MKKIVIFVIILTLMLELFAFVSADNTVKVILNGSKLVFDVNPIIENGRTLVPVRKIFESLGAKVTWTGHVIAEKDNTKIDITIGSTTAIVNGNKITLDVPAKIINDRTLVPLRFVSESLGTVVNWDNATYTVSINTPKLMVSYIDVGQADCELIQTPGGKNILIDAGNDDDKDTIINYLKNKNISKIDAVIASHMHSDHIGAMDDVIKAFNVDNFYTSKATETTSSYNHLIEAVNNRGLSIKTLKAGDKLNLDSSINLDILAPQDKIYENLNNSSVVIKLVYNKASFLFEGDSETESENEMLSYGSNLDIDILKTSHHGSSSSCEINFLNKVTPKYAIISVGANNSYNHPAQNTIQRLQNCNAQILRTDELGTITCGSDGIGYVFNKKPSNTNISPVVTKEIVYIAESGTKYHKDSCKYLSKSKIPINKKEAIEKGYEACSFCKP
jgi:competence protein ComEC